jgi:heptosyltransferase-3
MHLLFISSNRIGDSLINLQVLNKYIRKNKKNIEVTLVSGSLPMPIYDDYTMISKRVILTKQKYNLHWFKLYKELSAFRYDEIVDFRSSLIGYFLRVKKRNIFRMKKSKNIYEQIHHKFDTDLKKDFKILTDRVRNIFPNSNYACLAPFTNWAPKEWPTEQYVNIAKYLIDRGIDKIFILGSEEESSKFHHFEPALGNKVINRCGKQHILNDYGLLQKSRLFIGNDSSMMHMAALSKTPTLGLFGPTNDNIYFPKIFDHCHLVRSTETFESLVSKTQNYTLNNCLMNDVSYNQVIDKVNYILNAQNF